MKTALAATLAAAAALAAVAGGCNSSKRAAAANDVEGAAKKVEGVVTAPSPALAKAEQRAGVKPPAVTAPAAPVAVAPVVGAAKQNSPTPTPATPAATPAPAAPTTTAPVAIAGGGQDFEPDAKLLYRVAACGGDGALPDAMTHGDAELTAQLTKVVDHHCKWVHEHMAEFQHVYFDKGRAFFDDLVPKTAPTTVVYPFGGGDLISALVAFPKATQITTISLELAGDPRRISTLTPDHLESSLSALRAQIGGLLSVGSNTSENLSSGQRNDLPGQVSSFMLGLVAGGYEPIAMRYFTLDDAGAIHYVTAADIAAADADAAAHKPKSLKHDWQSPNFSTAFGNVEIEYRKVGSTDPGDVRVHRHIGWNLGDDYMKKHPQLLAYLAAQGKVTILTKGGSYMLWRADFSAIRDYMLAHAAWMLSDSTGIPPGYAAPAGMVQEVYGNYDGAFLESVQGSQHDEEYLQLWRTSPKHRLPFRFGYVDSAKQAHLIVTHPKA